MKKQTLNEQLSRIKDVMGILNEQSQSQSYLLIRGGAGGPGTDTKKLLQGFQLIKSAADYQKVDGEVKKFFGGYGSLIEVLNGELGVGDLAVAQQIQASLKAAGINLQFKKGPGSTEVSNFTIVSSPVQQQSQQVNLDTPGSWWSTHPALVAYLRGHGTPIHFPPMNAITNGAIALEVSDGKVWDFFSDGRWYQYKTVAEGLTATTAAEWEGKWSEKGSELVVVAKDGETFTSTTKKWVKAKPKIQWVKETGNFPLMYGQVGPTVKVLQLALGLKGDTYFGPVTEKSILTKAPEYKRETGVTQDIYNKIVNASKPEATTQTDTTPPTETQLQQNPNTLNPY